MAGERGTFLGNAQNVFSHRAGISNAEIFHALVRHERHRADRDESYFSLVVFDAAGEKKMGVSVREFCRLLKKELRTIDEIGWFDQRTVGVLLPSTDASGGRVYAERVLSQLPANAAPPAYNVLLYPADWEQMLGDAAERDRNEAERKFTEKTNASFYIKVPLWKRVLDVSFASLGLLILWPFFLLIGLYIKLVSPGPVFFKQGRVGYRGKVFNFIKFRTMKFGNDQKTHESHIVERIRSDSALAKLDTVDPRIIPGGRFLRAACVDELPQLFNVILGNMSLVGPRPCLPYEAKEFLRWHRHRFDVLPGMTGLWQVSGKNRLTFSQMIRLDIKYSNMMSPWYDVSIIMRTIPAIFKLLAESSAAKKNNKQNNEKEKKRTPMAVFVATTVDPSSIGSRRVKTVE